MYWKYFGHTPTDKLETRRHEVAMSRYVLFPRTMANQDILSDTDEPLTMASRKRRIDALAARRKDDTSRSDNPLANKGTLEGVAGDLEIELERMKIVVSVALIPYWVRRKVQSAKDLLLLSRQFCVQHLWERRRFHQLAG